MPTRDPVKAPKDRLQAQVVQLLWDEYLHRLERPLGEQASEQRTREAPG